MCLFLSQSGAWVRSEAGQGRVPVSWRPEAESESPQSSDQRQSRGDSGPMRDQDQLTLTNHNPRAGADCYWSWKVNLDFNQKRRTSGVRVVEKFLMWVYFKITSEDPRLFISKWNTFLPKSNFCLFSSEICEKYFLQNWGWNWEAGRKGRQHLKGVNYPVMAAQSWVMIISELRRYQVKHEWLRNFYS